MTNSTAEGDKYVTDTESCATCLRVDEIQSDTSLTLLVRVSVAVA